MKIQKTKVQKETSVSYAKKAALAAALGLSMSVFVTGCVAESGSISVPEDPQERPGNLEPLGGDVAEPIGSSSSSMTDISSSSSDTAYVELPADPNKPVEK